MAEPLTGWAYSTIQVKAIMPQFGSLQELAATRIHWNYPQAILVLACLLETWYEQQHRMHEAAHSIMAGLNSAAD